MTNTSKPSAALGTASKPSEFTHASLKLTLYYVLSTLGILVVTSSIILTLFTPPTPAATPITTSPVLNHERGGHTEVSRYEFREHLRDVVVVSDIFVLLLASLLSYFFARRTLQPIEDVYKRQTQFVSDVAHELRTPLAVMRSGAETMLRQERSAAEYRDFITDSHDEVLRLGRLTDQLLALLSSRQSERELTAVDLDEIAAATTKRQQAYADDHHITLTYTGDASATILGDRDQLTQLLQNLIKNALDYNTEQGTVDVSLDTDDNRVTLTVRDTGIGIDPALQDRLFDRFYKVDAARSGEGGAGLGLSIVKEIADRHHGEIALSSTPGTGTTIAISFPAAPTSS